MEENREKIERFFEKHKIEARQETGRSYVFDCPVCGSDKKLYVQKKDGRGVCFRQKETSCPKASDKLEYILSVVSGLAITEVKRELEEGSIEIKDVLEVSFDGKKKEDGAVQPMKAGSIPMDAIPIGWPGSEPGQKYLEGRGITFEMMRKYCFLYSGAMRRVIFPVMMNGTMYGWQGRAIDPVDKNFRMYNLPGEWKSRTLMFHQNIVGSEFVIIAEGPVSALKFEKVGGFVASMGKAVSKDQMDMIRAAGVKKIYLALDRDAADNTAKLRDYFMVKAEAPIQCYLISVPDHRDDFGDCTFDECETAFLNATPVAKDDLFLYLDPKNRW